MLLTTARRAPIVAGMLEGCNLPSGAGAGGEVHLGGAGLERLAGGSPADPLVQAAAQAVEQAAGRAPDAAGFTDESIRFLRELPGRRSDDAWHEHNAGRYERHLRRPLGDLLEQVRTRHIELLSPEVAHCRRALSPLKKNGYGKGRYHDGCGFAFYDPAVSSKARSPQLYFRLDGADGTCEYGFTTCHLAEPYLQHLRRAAKDAPDAVCAHLKDAPEGTRVSRLTRDHERHWTAGEWRALLRGDSGLALGSGLPVTEFSIRKVFPVADLPARGGQLAQEVGDFFAWAWPFFEASRTGRWADGSRPGPTDHDPASAAGAHVEVDEQAPQTVEELSARTFVPVELLRDMEDALLSRNQIVLTGPPGTSKTFIAGQFARYFARQGGGRPQGVTHTLYMHASWAYEDFFEGLRPVDHAGRLVFENRPGQFLRWVGEELWGRRREARHVLVLDELNRCDTAVVIGELLQLLECRGTTVRLLSGRPFVFPPNLYIIGTMNSADRSVGRLDLALRRRFFWIDLHPQPQVLQAWLRQPGNNPAGFDADALRAANDLLARHGVPPEQQIGHALFMGVGDTAAADSNGDGAAGSGAAAESALTERKLRQIVQFSVVPYVRELLVNHTGRGDDDLTAQIASILLGGPDKG